MSSRKPTWATTLVMLLGGIGGAALVFGLAGMEAWSGVLAGLVFWPFAFAAGVAFTWDDDD